MMDFISVVVIPAIALAWAIVAYLQRKQRPLSEFSKQDMDAAFKFAPEKRAEVVNRGTMSRYEFIELQKLNLKRINQELARRGEK